MKCLVVEIVTTVGMWAKNIVQAYDARMIRMYLA